MKTIPRRWTTIYVYYTYIVVYIVIYSLYSRLYTYIVVYSRFYSHIHIYRYIVVTHIVVCRCSWNPSQNWFVLRQRVFDANLELQSERSLLICLTTIDEVLLYRWCFIVSMMFRCMIQQNIIDTTCIDDVLLYWWSFVVSMMFY